MEDMDHAIGALVEELKNVKSQADITENLNAWKKTTQFDWYLFALNRCKSMQVSEHVIFSNYPAKWMEKYQSQKLYQVDPVVKYVLNHQNAIFWDSFKDMNDYNSVEQSDFLAQAAKFGLVSGCSIPCNSYGNFAVFSVANKCKSKLNKMNEYLPLNHFYGNQLLESVLKMDMADCSNDLKKGFTEREIECLFWGSEGKTAWEISVILGISERTVVFHFTNATEKLNASNRQHAISKAMLYGIVRPGV